MAYQLPQDVLDHFRNLTFTPEEQRYVGYYHGNRDLNYGPSNLDPTYSEAANTPFYDNPEGAKALQQRLNYNGFSPVYGTTGNFEDGFTNSLQSIIKQDPNKQYDTYFFDAANGNFNKLSRGSDLTVKDAIQTAGPIIALATGLGGLGSLGGALGSGLNSLSPGLYSSLTGAFGTGATNAALSGAFTVLASGEGIEGAIKGGLSGGINSGLGSLFNSVSGGAMSIFDDFTSGIGDFFGDGDFGDLPSFAGDYENSFDLGQQFAGGGSFDPSDFFGSSAFDYENSFDLGQQTAGGGSFNLSDLFGGDSGGIPTGTAQSALSGLGIGGGGSGGILGGIGSLLRGIGGGSALTGGIRAASGLYDLYARNQQADALQNRFNQLNDSVNNLYAPGSPEALRLRQTIERQDAKAGRNSQYGPREVDLAARIADIKARQTAALQGGQNSLLGSSLDREYSGFNTLASLFGRAGDSLFGS